METKIHTYVDTDGIERHCIAGLDADNYTIVNGYLIPKTPAQQESEARDRAVCIKLVELQDAYNKATKADIIYNGSPFQVSSAITDVLTSVANGWVLPTGFSWRDSNNIMHPCTVSMLRELLCLIADRNATLFATLVDKKGRVAQAVTAADVLLVN